MPQIKTVEILMLVTPPELPICRFTVPALKHLSKLNGVSITVYANGIAEKDELYLRSIVPDPANIRVVSNRKRLDEYQEAMIPGEWYITDSGRRELRVGPYESAPEVWERELARLQSDLVGIMDSDFEVFDSAFLPEMIAEFNNDKELGFMSVAHSPTQRVFDTYSKQYCEIRSRYHTWFCLYLSSAIQVSHDFSFYEEDDGEIVVKYDHSARLQEELSSQYGFHGSVLNAKWAYSYLHYGAFAQNRSLDGGWLKLYRLCRIGRHNGWYHKHSSRILASIVRGISVAGYKFLRLGRFDRERSIYRFEAN